MSLQLKLQSVPCKLLKTILEKKKKTIKNKKKKTGIIILAHERIEPMPFLEYNSDESESIKEPFLIINISKQACDFV